MSKFTIEGIDFPDPTRPRVGNFYKNPYNGFVYMLVMIPDTYRYQLYNIKTGNFKSQTSCKEEDIDMLVFGLIHLKPGTKITIEI